MTRLEERTPLLGPASFYRGVLAIAVPVMLQSLLTGLDDLERLASAGDPDREYYGRFDAAALRPYLRRLNLVAAARGLPRVLLAHARDDEAVPFAHSERLAAVLAAPTRFIALDEGGHHGPGRSPEVARATLDWVVTNAA